VADDIVTRLRHMAWTAPEGEPWADAVRDAADEIERLRAAGNRVLDAFKCLNGLNNTHLLDEFLALATLIDRTDVSSDLAATIARLEARRG